MSVISTIDDLNYPEKTTAYYIVNAPYVFSACWKVCFFSIHVCQTDDVDSSLLNILHLGANLKLYLWQVVRPLLQERTRNKVQVLPGSGKDELLKVWKLLTTLISGQFLLLHKCTGNRFEKLSFSVHDVCLHVDTAHFIQSVISYLICLTFIS